MQRRPHATIARSPLFSLNPRRKRSAPRPRTSFLVGRPPQVPVLPRCIAPLGRARTTGDHVPFTSPVPSPFITGRWATPLAHRTKPTATRGPRQACTGPHQDARVNPRRTAWRPPLHNGRPSQLASGLITAPSRRVPLKRGREGVVEPKSPKAYVPKTAKSIFPFVKFHFFPL